MVPRQQSETIRSELPRARYGIPCLAADMSQGIKGKLFTVCAMREERRRSVSVWSDPWNRPLTINLAMIEQLYKVGQKMGTKFREWKRGLWANGRDA